MTSERYVFDVIMRHSGAATREEFGQISSTFARQGQIIAGWIETGAFRKDVSPNMLWQGIVAFAVQGMTLKFCAFHKDEPFEHRLSGYLSAWLRPVG